MKKNGKSGAANDTQKKIQKSNAPAERLPISRWGIYLLAIGFGVMVAGYVLMTGGGSDNPQVFNYAMFDVRRTVIAPIVILSGVAVIMVGILRKPKQ